MPTVNKAYNDGVCIIGRETTERTSFGSRQGAMSVDEIEQICKMHFAEQSRRMQDGEYANQMGYKLDRKISVRKPGNLKIDTECAVVIGTVLYHVSDADYTSTEIYLSLTEVRDFAGSD